MPECEWCPDVVSVRHRVPNPGWVKRQPGDLAFRNVLYVCRRCAEILTAAAKEEAAR